MLKASKSAPGPIPLSCSSLGEWYGPAARITSRLDAISCTQRHCCTFLSRKPHATTCTQDQHALSRQWCNTRGVCSKDQLPQYRTVLRHMPTCVQIHTCMNVKVRPEVHHPHPADTAHQWQYCCHPEGSEWLWRPRSLAGCGTSHAQAPGTLDKSPSCCQTCQPGGSLSTLNQRLRPVAHCYAVVFASVL